MGKMRLVFFSVLFIAGLGLAVLFYFYQPKTQLDSSLTPMYQLFGRVSGGLNQALTQVVPVGALDEKEYGEAIRMECDAHADAEDQDFIYVNAVMLEISRYTRKPFKYKVYINQSPEPNACALPGGVIFVTRGLLSTLGSEAELASILAHEMGHIELSHCLDQVRMQLALKKIGEESLGQLADFSMALLLRHSFSKTQEDDADTYAFEVILAGTYDPAAQGRAFETFREYCRKTGEFRTGKANVIRDYFMSHPPLALRVQKFSAKAEAWWDSHPEEKRYVGAKNLEMRERRDFEEEWRTH